MNSRVAYCENGASGSTAVAECRILHVLDHSWPTLSGYAVRSRGLITAQARLGQDIAVITGPLHQMDDPFARDIEIDGVPHFRTTVDGRWSKLALRQRWPMLRELEVVRLLRNRILRFIEREGVDIVYAHSPALCGLAALQAARKRGLPFVYEIRAFWEDAAVDQERTKRAALRYRLSRQLETHVARNADAVCGIATNILEDLQSRGISSHKLFHVPNGVDTERFAPRSPDDRLKTELGLAGMPVLGFFGSLYRYEGISWLIRAAAELRSRGNCFGLLIIGRGEEQDSVRAAIRAHKMEENTRLLDHVPHDHITRYYSIVDAMVFPRLSIRLTELVTPLKPLEAMSLKKAVLASSVGGMREVVQHETTGLLFAPENVEEFCCQAEKLLQSPELRGELGENGRTVVLREKDWKVLARRYQNVYDYVLRNASHPGQLLSLKRQSNHRA